LRWVSCYSPEKYANPLSNLNDHHSNYNATIRDKCAWNMFIPNILLWQCKYDQYLCEYLFRNNWRYRRVHLSLFYVSSRKSKRICCAGHFRDIALPNQDWCRCSEERAWSPPVVV